MRLKDEDLLTQIQQGSEHAFEELYTRYEKRLYGFICIRLGNRQDAEDILQEAMLTIVKCRDIAFTSGGFEPWIYKICLNLCLNKLRRKNLVLASEDIDQNIDPADAPDVILLKMQKQQSISRAVENLPATLLKLYRMWAEGQSYDDMARETNLPLGTVKSRIHTAIARLRQELKS